MDESNETAGQETPKPIDYEPKGKVDLVSVLYVVGGVPFMIAFFSFSALLALLGFGLAGLVSVQSAWLALAAYPALYLGDKLGYALFRRHGGSLYRRLAIAALLLIGTVIVLRALLGFLSP